MFLVLMTTTEAKVYYFYRASKLIKYIYLHDSKTLFMILETYFFMLEYRLIITLLPASTECMAVFLKITFWKHDSNTFARWGFIYMHHV